MTFPYSNNFITNLLRIAINMFSRSGEDLVRSAIFEVTWKGFFNLPFSGMSTGIVAYITALSNLPLPQVWTVFYLAAVILTGIDGQVSLLIYISQVMPPSGPRV